MNEVSATNPLGVAMNQAYLLADERVEINWDPVDIDIPEELEYLSNRHELPTHRTEMQAILKGAPIEYLFTQQGLWRGVRCPWAVWELMMRAKGATDEIVAEVKKASEEWPKKRLVPMDEGQA